MIDRLDTTRNASAGNIGATVNREKYHVNDVEYGFGYIRWVDAVQSLSFDELVPAGWILPGGERVFTWQEAHWAAMAIHDAFLAARKRPVAWENTVARAA